MTPPRPADGVAGPAQLAAMRALRTDHAVGSAVIAMREVGIEPVLLRGPAIGRRLYEPGEVRDYVDGDLLIDPDARPLAESVLRKLGYVQGLGEGDFVLGRHAVDWSRAGDGSNIDLHWTIAGTTAAPRDTWHVLSAHVEQMALGGTTVCVPTLAGVAFIVALHAAAHGDMKSKPIGDLERAVERLERPVWEEARTMAEQLGARPAFSAGLSAVPQGVDLARGLGVDAQEWAQRDLHLVSAPRGALTLYELTEEPSWRRRAWMVYRSAFPSRGMLLRFYPEAERSRRALASAHARRFLTVATELPAAWRTARAARRNRS